MRGVCLLVVVLIAIFLLDALLTPTIRTLAELECRRLAASAVNSAVMETLEREGIRYEDLVLTRTNEEGLVTSISADVVKLNKLRAQVGEAINREFGGLSHRRMEIPMLSLFGIDFLMGKGPVLTVHLKMHGESFGNFYSEFDSVGVNQTRHRIFLAMDTRIYLFWNGNEEILAFETQVNVAETVIVGAVPTVDFSG